MKPFTLSSCPTSTIHLAIPGFGAIKIFHQLRLASLFTLPKRNPPDTIPPELGTAPHPFFVSPGKTTLHHRKRCFTAGSALALTLVPEATTSKAIRREERVATVELERRFRTRSLTLPEPAIHSRTLSSNATSGKAHLAERTSR